MTYVQLLEWALRHHYPSLVLCNGERVDAGMQGWFNYLHDLTEQRFERIVERVEQAQRMEAKAS